MLKGFVKNIKKHLLGDDTREYHPTCFRTSARAYYDMQIVLFKVPKERAIKNVIKAHLEYYGTEPIEFLKEIGYESEYGKIQGN